MIDGAVLAPSDDIQEKVRELRETITQASRGRSCS